MKRLYLFAAALVLAAMTAATSAHYYTFSKVEIVHPRAQPSLKGVANGTVYMAITNTSDSDVKLASASTPVAETAEFHKTTMQDGVMRMRPIEGDITIPANETVLFEPGGTHLMLIGLKRELKPKEKFALKLGFDNPGEKEIEVIVMDKRGDGA